MRHIKAAFLVGFLLCWLFTIPLTVSHYRKLNDTGIVKVLSKIDPNNAGLHSLTRLPGIGPSLANAIIEYRQKSKRQAVFKTAEDLLDVKGIGAKKLIAIKPYLYFGS